MLAFCGLKYRCSLIVRICEPVILLIKESCYITNTKHDSEEFLQTYPELSDKNMVNKSHKVFVTDIK